MVGLGLVWLLVVVVVLSVMLVVFWVLDGFDDMLLWKLVLFD